MAGENWFLGVVRDGIEPRHEANTSRYVHEVFRACLGWPMESIVPQASKRGFIDYVVAFQHPTVSVHVEVKPFGVGLRDLQIRKYLVRRGPAPAGLEVGVLTNLKEWNIYLAGPAVKTAAGDRMVQVTKIDIEGRTDIGRLRELIGYRTRRGLRMLRTALGECEAVLFHLA